MAGAIAQDRQRCQFPFVVDEKPTFVLGGSAGERSGGARRVPSGPARSNSERAGAVSLRWQAVFGCQIVWTKSTRRASARGGLRAVENHRHPARRVTVFPLPRELTLTVFSQLRKDEMTRLTRKAR